MHPFFYVTSTFVDNKQFVPQCFTSLQTLAWHSLKYFKLDKIKSETIILLSVKRLWKFINCHNKLNTQLLLNTFHKNAFT